MDETYYSGGEDSEYDEQDNNVDSEEEYQSGSSSDEEIGDQDRGDQEEDRGIKTKKLGMQPHPQRKRVILPMVVEHNDFGFKSSFRVCSLNERIAELEKQLGAERKLRELKDEEFNHLSSKMQIQEQTLASKDEESKRLSATVQEQEVSTLKKAVEDNTQSSNTFATLLTNKLKDIKAELAATSAQVATLTEELQH
ncbi:hypothetical protein L6452_05114 [Arctium lappa]|uniref:Uncharacterized protein n=1 Tax=Arctium lappa TaxID=4217 RepID=A0ACB9EG61_ARCLA|nr:hypothetical protein L6452_05114 [Arctium lappa]